MSAALKHLFRIKSLPLFSYSMATSSKKPPPSMSDYLMKRLSFTKPEADAISSKHLSHLTSTANPDAVISFLRRDTHLSPSQLHRLVRLRPSLLLANIKSILHPKLALFKSLLPPNPPPADLAVLVSSCASALGYSAARLSSSLSLLHSLLLNHDSKVVSSLRRYPRLLTNDPANVLDRNAKVNLGRSLSKGLRMAKGRSL